jgi:hypothetical protein
MAVGDFLFRGGLCLALVFLTGCLHSEKKLTFVQQRAHYNWRLPEQVFKDPIHWDEDVDFYLKQKSCSPYLPEYIKQSSDIIDIDHVFSYDGFDLSDECLSNLVLFTKFYLEHHASGSGSEVNYKLDLSNNPRLTNRAVAYLIELLKAQKSIKRVDLHGNILITSDAASVLEQEGQVQVEAS